MNFGQIVTTIGQRTGLVGPNDAAACSSFLTMRHDQMYRGYLWKDSIAYYVVPVDPTVGDYAPQDVWMPTKSQLLLPSDIAHVLAARTDHGLMNVVRPMLYFRTSYHQFEKHGRPVDFYTPAKAVWEFDTPQAVVIQATNASDVGNIITIDYGDADGASVDRVAVQLAATNTTAVVATTDKIVGVTCTGQAGAVNFLVGNTVIFSLAAGLTSAAQSDQIRTVRIIHKSTNIHVLGKRVTPPFAASTDVPGINGLDGVLFALAYYDMCLRDERDMGTASEAVAEAVGPKYFSDGMPGGFLKKLIQEETDQAASNTRIIPGCGFGGDHYEGEWQTKSEPY